MQSHGAETPSGQIFSACEVNPNVLKKKMYLVNLIVNSLKLYLMLTEGFDMMVSLLE